jgi:hypothetical protein
MGTSSSSKWLKIVSPLSKLEKKQMAFQKRRGWAESAANSAKVEYI